VLADPLTCTGHIVMLHVTKPVTKGESKTLGETFRKVHSR
jgi:hypothetical protein